MHASSACRVLNLSYLSRTVVEAQPPITPGTAGASIPRNPGSRAVSNNPYMSTTPEWAYTDKNTGKRPEYKPREDNRARCRMCDIPMVRAWFYISVDGPAADNTENKFDNDDFCSIRCMKRRLNGLPDNDERAMAVLIRRAEDAEAEARDARSLSNAHVSHLENIRIALAAVLDTAPGLVEGAVPPPGGLLARQVATLQSTVGQRVYADEDPYRRRPKLPRQHF